MGGGGQVGIFILRIICSVWCLIYHRLGLSHPSSVFCYAGVEVLSARFRRSTDRRCLTLRRSLASHPRLACSLFSRPVRPRLHQYNYIDDLYSLDPELYRNLMQLKVTLPPQSITSLIPACAPARTRWRGGFRRKQAAESRVLVSFNARPVPIVENATSLEASFSRRNRTLPSIIGYLASLGICVMPLLLFGCFACHSQYLFV